MEPAPVIYFDLDDTLFDNEHAQRQAISAMLKEYSAFTDKTVEKLVEVYDLQKEFDEYEGSSPTDEEAEDRRIEEFFETLGLPEPDDEEYKQFQDKYRAAYRANRRPTAGTVEVLVRLLEKGYFIGVIANGQVEDQTDKAKAIGILHLVDRIITSEEAGRQKPEFGIFSYAIKKLGLNLKNDMKTYMVGDSAFSDVKGAFKGAMTPIMYSPTAQASQSFTEEMYGREVLVISHMTQLLVHLGITSPQFTTRVSTGPGILTIVDLGIDMVTESQRSLHMSNVQVQSLAERMGNVLACAGKRRHKQAVDQIQRMIKTITTKAVDSDDKTTTRASGRSVSMENQVTRVILVTVRDHSTRVEYKRLTLPVVSGDEETLRDIAFRLQEHCHGLMRDDPDTAIDRLRGVIQILTEHGKKIGGAFAGRDRTKPSSYNIVRPE